MEDPLVGEDLLKAAEKKANSKPGLFGMFSRAEQKCVLLTLTVPCTIC